MKPLSTITLLCVLAACYGNNSENTTTKPSPQKKEEIKPVDTTSIFIGEFIFGMFNGESNSAPMFRFNNMGNATTLWGDYNKTFFKDADNMKFETVLNQPELIEIAYEVLEQLPDTLINYPKENMKFGCPDCTDAGGIYIQIQIESGTTKRFYLDLLKNKDMPDEIYEYANFVRLKIGEIMK